MAAGTEIHWLEQGEGAPVVLLHGLNDSHRTWERVAGALSAQGRRVLMPDLAGHGLSGRPDESYALEWHARVMAAWLDTIDGGPVDLVGHSFGGGVAQWLLLHRRARVRRLALVAAGGLGREVYFGLRLASASPLIERFGQPFLAQGTRMGMRAVGGQGVFLDEEIAWLSWANAMPGTARAFSRTVRDVIGWRGQTRHFLDRAHEIGELPPTALYWGESDVIIPFAHARVMQGLLENASLTTFPRCGHFPHRECPRAFALALGAFLDAEQALPARVRYRLARYRPRRSRWVRSCRAVLGAARRLLGLRAARVGPGGALP